LKPGDSELRQEFSALGLRGGARSLALTFLRAKFPANREKYREFSHFAPQEIRIAAPIQLRALGLSAPVVVKASNLTGNFQEVSGNSIP
jgi:hypothetical protein